MSAEYSALAVPALKALCKERGLSGYSKLTRQALIDKLSGSATPIAPVTSNALATSHPAPEARSEQISTALIAPKDQSAEGSAITDSQNSSKPAKRKKQPVVSKDGAETVKKARINPTIAEDMMEHTGDTVTDKFHKVVDPMKTTKNRATRAPSSNVEGILAVSSSLNVFANPALPSVQPPATKPLTSPGLDQFHNNAAKAPMRVNFLAPSFVVPKTPGIENVPIITTQLVAKKSAAPTRPLLLPPSKPFVKLVPTRKPSNQSFKTPTDFQPSPSSTAPHLRYLDFAPSNSEGSFAPKNISLPPRISQRQRTSRLAIILSQLSDSSRRACCLVSKSWRYAVFLSAQTILEQDYRGVRLNTFLVPYRSSLSQLNLWPYLRYRQEESWTRRSAYQKSFLYSLFRFLPICANLWCSPDDERQIVVVLRFLMARTWLSVNIGDQRAAAWTKSVILDAQPARKVSEGESDTSDIWKVIVSGYAPSRTAVTSTSRGNETFWVIAETGEVIGHAKDDPFAMSQSSESNMTIRTDWSGFLESGSTTRLLDRIRWSNIEDYEQGISRHWLKRRLGPDATAIQKAEKVVAERYVVASVAGNSLSGNYQTSTEMAQEFAGGGSITGIAHVNRHLVSLYIPEHHYVESVHFTTGRGEPLHPALAVIQTPMRECYILRDTGSEVGTEEEGVKVAWMESLRCNSKGLQV